MSCVTRPLIMLIALLVFALSVLYIIAFYSSQAELAWKIAMNRLMKETIIDSHNQETCIERFIHLYKNHNLRYPYKCIYNSSYFTMITTLRP